MIKRAICILGASVAAMASVPALADEPGDVTVEIVAPVPDEKVLPDPSDAIPMDPVTDEIPSRAGDDGIIQPYERNIDGPDVAVTDEIPSPEIYQTFGGADFGDQTADRAADQAAERVETAAATKPLAEPGA